ncbi:MAG: hypothetical protein ACJ76P_12970 [Actinomycetota bacterium]
MSSSALLLHDLADQRAKPGNLVVVHRVPCEDQVLADRRNVAIVLPGFAKVLSVAGVTFTL